MSGPNPDLNPQSRLYRALDDGEGDYCPFKGCHWCNFVPELQARFQGETYDQHVAVAHPDIRTAEQVRRNLANKTDQALAISNFREHGSFVRQRSSRVAGADGAAATAQILALDSSPESERRRRAAKRRNSEDPDYDDDDDDIVHVPTAGSVFIQVEVYIKGKRETVGSGELPKPPGGWGALEEIDVKERAYEIALNNPRSEREVQGMSVLRDIGLEYVPVPPKRNRKPEKRQIEDIRVLQKYLAQSTKQDIYAVIAPPASQQTEQPSANRKTYKKGQPGGVMSKSFPQSGTGGTNPPVQNIFGTIEAGNTAATQAAAAATPPAAAAPAGADGVATGSFKPAREGPAPVTCPRLHAADMTPWQSDQYRAVAHGKAAQQMLTNIEILVAPLPDESRDSTRLQLVDGINKRIAAAKEAQTLLDAQGPPGETRQ